MQLEKTLRIISPKIYKDYAEELAQLIIEQNLHNEIFYIAFTTTDKKIAWKSAYILEKIYFNYPKIFTLFEDDFINNFSLITNDGAKRHYSKIAYHIISNYNKTNILPLYFTKELQNNIAQNISEWIIDPKTKVAVVIWSMEILKALRPHIYWIEQSWEDIVENVVSRNTPAIQSRIKNSWSK